MHGPKPRRSTYTSMRNGPRSHSCGIPRYDQDSPRDHTPSLPHPYLESEEKAQPIQVSRTQQRRVPSTHRSQNLHHARAFYDGVSDPSYSVDQHISDRLPILENVFFNAVGGFGWLKAQWWRKAFKLLPVAYRRARLRDNLRSRLSREERPELCNLQNAITRARNYDLCQELEALWNRADEGEVRQLPLRSGNSLIPVLQG